MPPRMTVTFRTKAYNQGQTIFSEGQDGSYACIIHSGRVGVFKDVGGEQVQLAVLERGEVFGEMALVADEKRTATVVALEYTEVVIVDRHRLQQALEASYPLVQALVRGLVQRLAQTTAMVRKQAQQSDKLKALVYLLQAWIESVPTDRSGGMSLPVAKLMEFGKAALRLPPSEMEGLLRELKEAGVLELTSTSRGRQVVLERPAQLLHQAGQVIKQLAEQEREAAEQTPAPPPPSQDETQTPPQENYIDIYELSREAGLAPHQLLERLARGEGPESMVFFSRQEALSWAARLRFAPQGPAPTAEMELDRRDQAPPAEQMPPVSLEALLMADAPLLQRSLAAIGAGKVAALVGRASERARKVILDNLSPSLRKELAAMGRLPRVSQDRFRQAVNALAAQIKRHHQAQDDVPAAEAASPADPRRPPRDRPADAPSEDEEDWDFNLGF